MNRSSRWRHRRSPRRHKCTVASEPVEPGLSTGSRLPPAPGPDLRGRCFGAAGRQAVYDGHGLNLAAVGGALAAVFSGAGWGLGASARDMLRADAVADFIGRTGFAGCLEQRPGRDAGWKKFCRSSPPGTGTRSSSMGRGKYRRSSLSGAGWCGFRRSRCRRRDVGRFATLTHVRPQPGYDPRTER